jgi:type II secretory pathway component GspD/PulD (secretin)
VPWLKDVPVLGYLFKTSTTESSQVERAYLITPRIVELNAANQNAQDFKLLIPTAEPDPVLTPKPFYSIPKYPPGPNAAPGASTAPVPMPHIFKP